ncbi:MAG: hypothetical protein HGA90_00075 [Alphaproteobacteria bacterium]|nr:hypothetical protein [Alphaproteobacteria bacterium]
MPKKTFAPSSFVLSSLLVAVGVAGFPAPSSAGFLWVAPTSQEQTVVSKPEIAPVAPPPQTLQVPPSARVAPSEPLVIMGSTGKEKGAAAMPLPSVVLDQGAPVQGFANNVPLAVALRQVLPPSYSFSAGQDVNMGTLVSWRGGQTWRSTMQDMLRSAGLAMREQDRMVVISRAPETAITAAPSVGTPEKLQGLAPAPAPLLAPPPAALAPAPALQPDVTTKPLPLLAAPAPEPSVALAPTPALAPAPVPVPVVTKVEPPISLAPSPQTLQLPPQHVAPLNPPAAAASVPQGPVVDAWNANRGDTLRRTLEDWAHRANIDLIWQAEYDYPVQASATLNGTFEEAVRGLLSGFQDAQPQPIGYFYNNQAAGQSVLVVQARGNNYSD